MRLNIRKVQNGEVAKVFLCCFIVGVRGLLFRGEKSEKTRTATQSNKGKPFAPIFSPANTLKSTLVRTRLSLMSAILRVGASAEVVSTVIQAIMIFMIRLFRMRCVEDDLMHKDELSTPCSASGVESVGCWIGESVPVPLRQPHKVSGIDNGILPLRQWNKFVGWVGRLNDLMALHPIVKTFRSWHGSYSNRNLQFSRHFITAIVLLFFALPVFSQSTTFTSTVVDTGGVTWVGGNYRLTFVGSQTVNWPGGAFNRVVSGTLDGTGSFSVSLPSTSTMTGGPASWTLQVTPITGISQGGITITAIATSGGTQPLTVTPNAIQIVGTSPLPVAAYADAEIIAPVQRGMIYYQVTSATAGTYRQCQGLTGNACTTWGNVASSGGGISSITTTSPITGGPITTTGTLACPTCVVGPSPGVAGQPAIYNGTNQIVSSMIYLDAAEVDTTVGHDICQRISTTLGTLVNNQVAYIYARPVLTPETCTVEPFAGLTATGTSGTLHLTAGVPSSVSAWKTPNFWWVEGNGRGTTIVADPSFADGANFAIIGDRGSDTGIASDRFDTGFRNMSIDCNSVVAITACVWSETAQEQAGLEHVLVKGCSTCIQFQKTANATPQNWHLDDLEVYPANVASAVGIDVDGGSSSLKTITDITILGKASDTNGLRINNARGGAVIGLHCEGLNDCVLIGDTGNDYGTYFANISGHSDVTTVVAIGNGGTQKGLSFSGLARLGATNLINDTYKTYLNQQDAVPFYSTGDITTDVGAIFNEGAQSNGDVHISVTSNTGSVGSKKLFLDGFYNNGATDFNVDSWTLNNLVNAGTNPATTLTFAHTGSSGTASVNYSIPHDVRRWRASLCGGFVHWWGFYQHLRERSDERDNSILQVGYFEHPKQRSWCKRNSPFIGWQ